MFNKNRNNDLFLILFKSLCLILGLNIFLTSILTVIKLEFKKNKFQSGININVNKHRYYQNN